MKVQQTRQRFFFFFLQNGKLKPVGLQKRGEGGSGDLNWLGLLSQFSSRHRHHIAAFMRT